MFSKKPVSVISILPLLVFVAIFLGGGIYLNNFYSLPTPLVALVAVIVALLIYKAPFEEKMNLFFKGAGESNVLKMSVIMLFAGAFSAVTKASGSVDSIVNLGLYYISPEFFPVGVFVIASFLSFSIGTSVGTITTLSPIAITLALESNSNVSLIGACLLSGAMFGDNLSLISDTTIAATQTMGCRMDEKMKANAKIALPAAVFAIILLIFVGMNQAKFDEIQPKDFDWVLILPYVLVVILSMRGVNVFVSLLSGIVFAGVLGFVYQKFNFLGLTNITYQGFSDMSETFLLFFFTGGLALLVEHFGGISFLMNFIQKRITSSKSALLGIGALVSSANICVANNTVSILIVSKVCKKIATRFKIPFRDGASVLDIFSCYVQGLLPYGAQVLVLVEASKNTIDYPSMMGYAFYLHLLLLSTLVYIFFRKKKTTDIA